MLLLSNIISILSLNTSKDTVVTCSEILTYGRLYVEILQSKMWQTLQTVRLSLSNFSVMATKNFHILLGLSESGCILVYEQENRSLGFQTRSTQSGLYSRRR